jgi:hypothetical protein
MITQIRKPDYPRFSPQLKSNLSRGASLHKDSTALTGLGQMRREFGSEADERDSALPG